MNFFFVYGPPSFVISCVIGYAVYLMLTQWFADAKDAPNSVDQRYVHKTMTIKAPRMRGAPSEQAGRAARPQDTGSGHQGHEGNEVMHPSVSRLIDELEGDNRTDAEREQAELYRLSRQDENEVAAPTPEQQAVRLVDQDAARSVDCTFQVGVQP